MKGTTLIYLIIVFIVPWYTAKWGIQFYAYAARNTRFALKIKNKTTLSPSIRSFKTLSALFLCCYLLLASIMLTLSPKNSAEWSLLYKKIFGYEALQIDITLNELELKDQQTLLSALNDILQEGHLPINKKGHYSLGRRMLSSRTYTDKAILKSRYRYKNNRLQIILPNQVDIHRTWPLENAWSKLENTATVEKTINATFVKSEQAVVELAVEPRTFTYRRTLHKASPCEAHLKAHLTAPELIHLQTQVNTTAYDGGTLLNISEEWPGFFNRYHIVKLSDLPTIKKVTNPIEVQQWLTEKHSVTLHLQTANTEVGDYRPASCDSLTRLETPLMAALQLEKKPNIAALAPIVKQVQIKPRQRFRPWHAGTGWREASLINQVY